MTERPSVLADKPAVGPVRRIFASLGLLLGGKAAAGLLSLAYMAIAARALGAEQYGILILLHTYVMTVAGICEIPPGQTLIRYGLEARSAEDWPRLKKLLRFATSVEITGGAIAIAVAMLLAPLVGPRLGWSTTAQLLAVPYAFAALGTLRSTPAGFLQMLGRFDLLGSHHTVQPLVRLIGAALAWAMGWGLTGFVLAWLLAAFAEWAVLWWLGIWQARQIMDPPLVAPTTRGVQAENPGLWKFLIGSNADITFGELAARATPLIVGAVLGPAAAGLYTIAQRATVVLAQPAQMLGSSAYSEFTKMVVRGASRSSLVTAIGRVIGISFLAAIPVILICAFFSRQIVTFLAGPDFAQAAPIMIWLVVARAILMVVPPCSAALLALGRPGLSVSANAGAGLLLLPLLPLLLHLRGLEGIWLHALVQAVVTSTVIAWLCWRATARLDDKMDQDTP